MDEVIREFKNRNSASKWYIRWGNTSESLIPSPVHSTSLTNKLTSFMMDVNNYYLRSLERIFGVKLESGLITLPKAQELCAKKDIQPHITDENLLIAPLTEEELGAVLLKFPDLSKDPMPPHALSPMVQ